MPVLPIMLASLAMTFGSGGPVGPAGGRATVEPAALPDIQLAQGAVRMERRQAPGERRLAPSTAPELRTIPRVLEPPRERSPEARAPRERERRSPGADARWEGPAGARRRAPEPSPPPGIRRKTLVQCNEGVLEIKTDKTEIGPSEALSITVSAFSATERLRNVPVWLAPHGQEEPVQQGHTDGAGYARLRWRVPDGVDAGDRRVQRLDVYAFDLGRRHCKGELRVVVTGGSGGG